MLDTDCWEQWLDEEYSEYLKTIRDKVKYLYEENKKVEKDLAFFTPHGPGHCQAVEDLLHKLIPGQLYSKLNEKERFYLLASAWLHDLGMLRLVVNEVYNENLSNSEIRKRHHQTVETFIVEQFERCGVEETDSVFLSKLCRYHRRQENLHDCEEELMVQNEKYCFKLLAAYLRLADSLHIDQSRTPSEAYAICLAYDIPQESKLHWVKSRLINGVFVDSSAHSITVQVKVPNDDQMNMDTYRHKIDYIVNLVVNDLREELSSVINVITRYGFSYFLDIEVKEVKQCMDRRMLNDLQSLVMYYDILVAPSASKLMEIILVTISNICGFTLTKNCDPAIFDESDVGSKEQQLNKFFELLEEQILSKRSCHLGLQSLTEQCKEISKLFLKRKYTGFVREINLLYQHQHECRDSIRSSAKGFFHNAFGQTSGSDKIYNVLLFGYSELVLKALCGFRDYLMSLERNIEGIDRKEFYGGNLEKRASGRIRIFICEGNSKTQCASGDRLIYHDGFQYALSLDQRGFSDIILIPDAVVGNIIENNNVDFILMGANGFTNHYFKHSAGHCTIVNLVKEYRSRNSSRQSPQIVLVVSSDKWLDNAQAHQLRVLNQNLQSDGFEFWAGDIGAGTRDTIWFVRDKAVYDKLLNTKILLYNPREDVVPIGNLDHVISDIGYFEIFNPDPMIIEENVKTFTVKIEENKFKPAKFPDANLKLVDPI